MTTIFEKIDQLSFPAEVKTKLSGELLTILVNSVISVAPERFTKDTTAQLQELGQQSKYQEMVSKLQEQFSQEEWETNVVQKIDEIVKSYEEEVLAVVA